MKYAIWDKQSDIYTLGRDAETGKMQWTAEEYIETHAPWAAIPAVKVIVGGGTINGTFFMEFEATKDFYQKQGAPIADGMTDDEVLLAIEEWEDHPPQPEPVEDETAILLERVAAALEFNNILNMPDIEEE